MPFLVITLRALHILGGIFWTGAALVLYGFVLPSAKLTQPESGRLLHQLVARSGLFVWMTVASMACFLAGLVLFSPISGHFDRDWMHSARGEVLSVGALVGVLAALEALFVTGPAARRLGGLLTAIGAGDTPPTQEQSRRLGELTGKLSGAGTRAAWMLSGAAILMAIARYV